MPGQLTKEATDPTHLSALGTSAARLAETSGLSLTEAVVHTIGQMKLSTEQVRRVVEATNIEAFNKKYSSMSGNFRAVHIDDGPADPSVVLQSVSTQQPQALTVDALEYSMPPGLTKRASVGTFVVDRTRGGVMQEIRELQSKLSSAHDELIQSAESSKGLLEDLLEKLSKDVRSASLEGAAPAEIFEAWARVDIDTAEQVFEKMSGLMKPNKKVASRQIRPDATVVVTFSEFAKEAQRCLGLTKAVKNVENELSKVSSWIKGRSHA